MIPAKRKTQNLVGMDRKTLSREELEAEGLRLRAWARNGSTDAARRNAIVDGALDFALVVTDRGAIASTMTGCPPRSGRARVWRG